MAHRDTGTLTDIQPRLLRSGRLVATLDLAAPDAVDVSVHTRPHAAWARG